ncbi:lipopolysaccharide biosynthesis protein [Parvularcula sp. LCG005]|uniref:lipopolysaccharide biosynthesis protein n=1 Tax=Parvularcula sp. LCG005 TaxID=3078805 RepID=UPI002943E4A8|nr:lipopolysaccharide biosynthesis protein [Parvularcula sp. LCG005]WOI51987.1 lipopolysaccharide biosynthesis protein [Parvularcula sp. LCG005]
MTDLPPEPPVRPDITDTRADDQMSRRVAKGAAWIASSRIIMRLVGFVNTLVLARLLVPEDFGVVAIGVAIMQLLQNVSDVGVSQAVIRFGNAERRHLDTLFTMSFIRGLIILTLLCGLAPFAGHFYDDDRVAPIFVSLGIIALMFSSLNPKFFEFERDLDFSREFFISIMNKGMSVAVSVAVAYFYRSYWAIVLGLGAGALTQLTLSYVLMPYRPRLTFSAFNEMLDFTGWLLGVSALAALNNKTETLFLGRFVGKDGIGNYYMGQQLAILPTIEVATPAARAIYPGLNQMQSDLGRMRLAFLRGAEALAMLAIPAAVGTAFIADDIIHLVLGQKWEDAIPVLRLMAPVNGLLSIYLSIQAFAMARGMTKPVFFRELIFFLIKTPVFVWAAIEYGLIGAIWVSAISGLLYVLLQARLYRVISGGRGWEPLWAGRRSFVGAAGISLYFVAIEPFIPGLASTPLVINVGINLVGAGLAYVAGVGAAWMIEGQPDGVERQLLSLAGIRGKGAKNDA